MKHNSKILRDVLRSIRDLESPQLEAYVEKDKYARPLYFSFRFKSTDENDNIYLKLINAVSEFDAGSTQWIMYKFKSKNYVIEPLIFYCTRRRSESGSNQLVIDRLTEAYKGLMDDAIRDLDLLAQFIERSIKN